MKLNPLTPRTPRDGWYWNKHKKKKKKKDNGSISGKFNGAIINAEGELNSGECTKVWELRFDQVHSKNS